MTENLSARYDRLARGLGGGDLEKGMSNLLALRDSTVAVVFDDPVGQYFAFPFAAAGMKVRLFSTGVCQEGEMFLDVAVKGNRARAYAEVLNKIIPGADLAAGIEGKIGFAGAENMLGGCAAVVDCTTDHQSKKTGFEICT